MRFFFLIFFYINDRILKNLWVISMLSINVQNYLKNITFSDDYSTNFNTLCTISEKLCDIDYDTCLNILSEYNNINNIVSSVVNNNYEVIKNHKILDLYNNKVFLNFIDAYFNNTDSYFDTSDLSNNKYYRFVDNIDILSSEEEKALFALLSNPDPNICKSARDRLILCNLRLVRSIAWKYSKNSRLSFEDLMEEGIAGLFKAIDNFDISKENKFSTYAIWWINQKINMANKLQTSNVKFSAAFREKMRTYLNIKRNYIKENGEAPTLQYMKKKMYERLRFKVSDKSLEELIALIERYSVDTISLSSLVGTNEGFYLEDIIPDDYVTFDIKLEEKELIDIIKNIFEIANLSDRDKEIISYRFGLNGYPRLTYEKLGKKFGVTHQRVRIIEKRILRMIRDNQACMNLLSGYHK